MEYKYDTQLLLEGENLDEDVIHDYIQDNIPGDCLLVAGGDDLVKLRRRFRRRGREHGAPGQRPAGLKT